MERDKNILVTGGTGFLGSYLLRSLIQKGHTKIRALKRRDSPMDLVRPVAHQIEWLEYDLLDAAYLCDALQGVHQVYHCAAMVSFYVRDRKQMFRTNVEGTANIVDASLSCGIEKLVHVSSVAAIGRAKNQKTISEATKWERSKLNTYYGISKYLAENEVWRGMVEGLNVAVVNPAIILGSGFWKGGPQEFFKLAGKAFPFYPTGSNGFVDVRDVAQFMILLMESDIHGERFILSGETWSYRNLLTNISKFMNKRPPTIKVSPFIQQVAWRLEWLRQTFAGAHPIITKETALTAANSFHYLNNKSLRTFDFEYTPIIETVRQTSLQFLEAQNEGMQPKFLELT